MAAPRGTHALVVALMVSVGCWGGDAAPTVPAGPPVETEPPNGAGQKASFPGQTRVPEHRLGVAYDVVTVARGFEYPWAVAFLPDGRLLVTERAGRLRIVGTDGKVSDPVPGIPPVDYRGQGGLLDVALDPSFAKNGLIYWSYAERQKGGNGTAVARGKLVNAAPPRLDDVRVIFRQTPILNSRAHFGCRLVFARDGTLFVTLGERAIPEGRMQAQRLDGHLGKIVRINTDGSIPTDNPFAGTKDARPEIWSHGHRNIQAAALHPTTGELWEVEHGARGGDEINIARPGKDYGWPTIAYGIEYNGKPITGNMTAKRGMEQPVYYWDPVIAPSGMVFYTGRLLPKWRGSLFVGALKQSHLVRLTVHRDRIVGEERLLTDLKPKPQRIRDVRQGPDGALYVVTDSHTGSILKIVPKGT
jgi:aldose sugar dehydrogenase